MNIPSTPRSIPSEESTRHFHPVLQPSLSTLYAARAARLRSLAEDHELQDYLGLAAAVADAQAAIVAQPFQGLPETAAQQPPLRTDTGTPDATQDNTTLLHPVQIAAAAQWHVHLDAILAALAACAPEALATHLTALEAMSATERTAAGIALAEGRFDAVPPALAPLLWAALSLEVARSARARSLPRTVAEESTHCPICGSAPVASLIHTGEDQGLRYLHCPLCECEWHMVRAKCTNCGDAGQLDYFSFDTAQAVVRAESCGHCSGYLKVVSQEADPKAEAVADDLATLALDDATTSEGFHRTGFNPFALPAGNS